MGEPTSTGGYPEPEAVVADLGRLGHESEAPPPDPERHVVRWLVVRGPCYLSLRAAVEHRWQPDGVILLAKPGRALSSSDVADVLGAPVVAQVSVEPVAARVIDAGLLLSVCTAERLQEPRSARPSAVPRATSATAVSDRPDAP